MKKILLVDDDQVITDMYAAKFNELGWQTAVAHKVAEAEQQLAEGLEPDLIILDIIMPGENGFEFLRRLRQGKKLGSKVVILSNLDYQKEAAGELAGQISGYFMKAQVTPSQLGEKIKEIFNDEKG